jgi:flagellar biosynthetic protein FliR
MEIGAGNILDWMLYFLLIFLRIISTFTISPIFGRNMPSIAKIVLSLCLSYIVLCVLPPEAPVAFNTLIEFVVTAFKEVILGLIFGFVIIMFMNTVYTAGQIIDLQLGFSFAQVYNPVTGSQSPISGTFLNILIVLIFFVTDSHLLLFRILYETFYTLPPGKVIFDPSIVKIIISAFVLTFEIGFKISLPILVASLITEVLLGVVMKAVPNVNFFVIGFPVKIFIGFFIMIAVIPVISAMSDYIFTTMYDVIRKLFEEMGRVTVG